MPIIRPVSDLKNYNEVLSEVREDSPVYLTKNGRGSCALVDIGFIDEYKKMKASLTLLSQVLESEKQASEEGWLTLDEAIKEAQNWK